MKLRPGEEEPYILGLDETQSQTLCYARDLRAIGQALESKKLLSLHLEFEAGDYLAHGQIDPRSSGGRSIVDVLCQVISSLLYGESVGLLKARNLETRFTAEQIYKIDLEGRNRRRDPNQTPDAHSLSQLLRGAGAYLDKHARASCIGITVSDRWVTLRYTTREGRLEETRQDIEFFYNYWVKMYLQRSNRPKMPSSSHPH